MYLCHLISNGQFPHTLQPDQAIDSGFLHFGAQNAYHKRKFCDAATSKQRDHVLKGRGTNLVGRWGITSLILEPFLFVSSRWYLKFRVSNNIHTDRFVDSSQPFKLDACQGKESFFEDFPCFRMQKQNGFWAYLIEQRDRKFKLRIQRRVSMNTPIIMTWSKEFVSVFSLQGKELTPNVGSWPSKRI